MKHTNTKIKLALILVFAFVSTHIISKTVFLANSPRINKQFLSALINNSRTFFANLGKNTSLSDNQKNALQQIEKLPSTALNQVSSGVYAKEDKKNNVIYIRITKDAEWEERIIVMDGKEIKVRFPKGSFSK